MHASPAMYINWEGQSLDRGKKDAKTGHGQEQENSAQNHGYLDIEEDKESKTGPETETKTTTMSLP
jgi:hypothetical protein